MESYNDNLPQKVCGPCKELKPITEFRRNRWSKDGFRSNCKQCVRIQLDSKVDHIRAQKKEYDQKNKDSISIKKKAHYRQNPEKAWHPI